MEYVDSVAYICLCS